MNAKRGLIAEHLIANDVAGRTVGMEDGIANAGRR
jgi:hypothetical protein